MDVAADSPWIAPAAALVLSAVTLALLARLRGQMPHDVPSGRSLHDRPVARVGGLSIWAGFLPVAVVVSTVPRLAVWLPACVAVAIVSIVDDWRGVSPRIRLTVHASAALVFGFVLIRPEAGASPGSSLALVVAAALVVVWSANLFNFMDGSDGLAGLMAIVGFGAYGVAALARGVAGDVYFALAAATVPFLLVNFPPARAFMGDGGSVPLGFLAAAFGIAGVHSGTWPAWFPLLVLHRLGAGHRGTLLLYGALMVGTAVAGLFALAAGPAAGWVALGAWSTAIAGLFAGIDAVWHRRFPGPQ